MAGLSAPVRKLMRNEVVSPCDIHNAHTGLKALGYDLRLYGIGPAPVAPPRLHHIAPSDKSIPSISHPSPLSALQTFSQAPHTQKMLGIDGSEPSLTVYF
ncbi:hypothetical protein [Paracoccus shandongensis]|uniref:hypothetical protein n=1 Tax=Paracoccus shandongensis TaxID=2816048 RepID=UPI00301410E7